MKHHYLETINLEGDSFKITGPKFHHLKNVLRLKSGDKLEFFDGTFKYFTELKSISQKEIIARVLKKEKIVRDKVKTWLAQAIPKGRKIDLIIEKISEIGIDGLIPFFSKYSQVRIEADKILDKFKRWRQIAIVSAEQSGRNTILEVCEPIEFRVLLRKFLEFDLVLVFWEKAKSTLREILKNETLVDFKRILMVIGPEGSFSEEELNSFKKINNVRFVSLGENVLRTETAGIVAGSIVLYELSFLKNRFNEQL